MNEWMNEWMNEIVYFCENESKYALAAHLQLDLTVCPGSGKRSLSYQLFWHQGSFNTFYIFKLVQGIITCSILFLMIRLSLLKDIWLYIMRISGFILCIIQYVNVLLRLESLTIRQKFSYSSSLNPLQTCRVYQNLINAQLR